jgi:hypothetical protein
MSPANTCAIAAVHRTIEAWNRSVPTTRLGRRENRKISPTEMSAPLPAEVTPITRPTHRPSTIAMAVLRVVILTDVTSFSSGLGVSRTRARRAAPVSRSAAPSREKMTVSKFAPRSRSRILSRITPAIAPGTEPIAIRVESGQIVCWRSR